MPSYQPLNTMVRRHIHQMIRTRNFRAQNENFGQKSQKGRMSAWVGEWENVNSGKQMDSAREETRAVPATGVIVDSKHNRPLLLQRRRHRLTIENARKVLAPRETSFWKERSESVQKLPQKKLHKSVVVIIDILPFVKNYKSDSGCKFGDTCLFRHTEADRQPSKKVQGTWWTRIGCCIEGVSTIGLRVPRYRAAEEVYSTEERIFWNKLHRHVLPGHAAPHKKSGEKGSIARSQSIANLKNTIRVQNFEDKRLPETLHLEQCVRREAWDLAKHVHELKTKDKATFYSLTEAWAMPAPSSKKPEEPKYSWWNPEHRCTC